MQQTVTIFCKNTNSFHTVPLGSSLFDILKLLDIKLKYPILAARVNYKVEDLYFHIYKPKNIEFIDISCPSGFRVYVRSLSMVMAKAVHDLQQESILRIEHPICHGYYCCINDRSTPVEPELIGKIKKRMQEIIAEDLKIVSEEQQTQSVMELFRVRGQMDKVILLDTLGVPYARFFRIGDFIDYYSSVLAPSTAYMNHFDLEPYENGILLKVPNRNKPDEMAPYENQDLMFGIFNEFAKWNKVMGLSNVGDFNKICRDSSVYNMIKISEALHEKKIAQIADEIRQRQPESKFVMISGPSSSGKTTFSKRLSIQLMVAGIKPIVLSLDNYFVNRVDTPLDEHGEWDFEALNAIDLPLLNEHMQRILAGEEVEVPFYNFEIGERQWRGDKVKITEGTVLVLEGIHALNPKLIDHIPESAMFKIYVSTLTTISLDNHNWIPTTDTRLLRRIIRDYKFRGYSARQTINRWPSVRRGEEKWIFPYQENADVMFNSALLFELAVLRKHAEPIIADVPQYCEEYTEAHRLLKFLKYFIPIHDNEIPPTSLLREFLGGSSFKY